MPPVGFEPIISAGQRPQNDTLDRAATGTGFPCSQKFKFSEYNKKRPHREKAEYNTDLKSLRMEIED
jgi:hypothetical protein